jgi:hypothetical protein
VHGADGIERNVTLRNGSIDDPSCLPFLRPRAYRYRGMLTGFRKPYDGLPAWETRPSPTAFCSLARLKNERFFVVVTCSYSL